MDLAAKAWARGVKAGEEEDQSSYCIILIRLEDGTWDPSYPFISFVYEL